MKIYKAGKHEKVIFGLLTMLLSFLLTMSYYHLWGTDLRVPISGYRSDSGGVLLEAANYVRGGNVHRNVLYAAPHASKYMSAMGDSSMPIPFIGMIWRLTGSVEAGVNVAAILNGVLLALSAYWLCTQARIRASLSMVLGVCYSALPFFVFASNTVLLIYAWCFYIPLFCWIMIMLMSEKPKTLKDTVFIIAVMLYLGLNSAYYAFFALIILALAGLYSLLRLKNVENIMLVLVSYVAVVFGIAVYTMPDILRKILGNTALWDSGFYYPLCIIVGAALCLLGSLVYKKWYSRITIKTVYVMLVFAVILLFGGYMLLKRFSSFIGEYDGRTYLAVEMGALNVGYLILPVVNTVWKGLNDSLAVMVDLDGGDFTMLGVLSGIGFIYSVLALFQYDDKKKDEVLHLCGLCNCFMALVAVKGGVASLIAVFVTTGIRNYNRICVYIACFSIVSFGILVEKSIQKIRRMKQETVKNVCTAAAACGAALLVSMSIPTDFIYNKGYGIEEYAVRKQEYDEWHALVGAIEEQLDEGDMVLQLPFRTADIRVGELMDAGLAYDNAIPAIVSKKTIWSYNGNWKYKEDIAEKIDDFIAAARESGFDGIYMDTLLYSDASYEIHLAKLEECLGAPLVSDGSRRYFFKLS
ncbi:MAG: hypothetical protein K2O40_03115 [Lachnospiraceae bacterium]|nr:hypothetical protein [Lachnospiraceae bacterium]